MSLALSTVCSLYAQDPTGALEGQVVDSQGAAVLDATVTVTNMQTGYIRSQSTASDGLYRLAFLPVGSYRLTIHHNNFSEFKQ